MRIKTLNDVASIGEAAEGQKGCLLHCADQVCCDGAGEGPQLAVPHTFGSFCLIFCVPVHHLDGGADFTCLVGGGTGVFQT